MRGRACFKHVVLLTLVRQPLKVLLLKVHITGNNRGLISLKYIYIIYNFIMVVMSPMINRKTLKDYIFYCSIPVKKKILKVSFFPPNGFLLKTILEKGT